jgi:hypothetical protein
MIRAIIEGNSNNIRAMLSNMGILSKLMNILAVLRETCDRKISQMF